MPGTIKLYQKGAYKNPDIRKDTIFYFSAKDRKDIIKRWCNFYGSAMRYHYVQISPDIDLRGKKIKA